jgi:hypothetical protein
MFVRKIKEEAAGMLGNTDIYCALGSIKLRARFQARVPLHFVRKHIPGCSGDGHIARRVALFAFLRFQFLHQHGAHRHQQLEQSNSQARCWFRTLTSA